MRPLSENQITVLLLIHDRCEKCSMFVPPYSGEVVHANMGKYVNGILQSDLKSVFFYGSVGSTMQALERRGLIRRPKTTLPQKFVYEMTEAGHQEVERYRSNP